MEKINEIIQKASEGSKFFQHKQTKQKKIDDRIQQTKEDAAKFTENQITNAQKEVRN